MKTAYRLVIDCGNTRTKVALFLDDQLIHVERVDHLTVGLLQTFRDQYSPTFAIISGVVEISQDIRNFLSVSFGLIELDHTTPVPVTNHYRTPETLGKDRLAGVVGARMMFPGCNCLVIDAGTCITFDMMDKDGIYYGGSISPGISMRFRALHNFTGRLPLISQRSYDDLIGTTTEESILSGVFNGVISEFEGVVLAYKHLWPDIKVIMTGGDMNFFDKRVKCNIFAAPNLVLFGLNKILDFNIKHLAGSI